MFCALKGATAIPRRRNQAQMAVTIQLLPELEDVPPTNSAQASAMSCCPGLALCLRLHPFSIAPDTLLVSYEWATGTQMTLRQQIVSTAARASLTQVRRWPIGHRMQARTHGGDDIGAVEQMLDHGCTLR